MNKDLIELQKGCKATCVVILSEDSNDLEPKFVIKSDISDSKLIETIKENVCGNEDLDYFVIDKIDEIDENMQYKYYHLVKDREVMGNDLPENIIIVLTVNDKEKLKNILQELYHFCVVAI